MSNQQQLDVLLQKNKELETEIVRYKETLIKMEKQWKTAVEAVNENKLQKIIDEQNQQLNNQNKLIITLKKENQTLRLKAHMVEDDIQPELKGPQGYGLSALTDNNNTQTITMERIKDLEKSLKMKDTEIQEKMIDYRGKINELELLIKTKDKNLETLNSKIADLLDENQSLRRMAQSDETTKLRIELKAAREKINLIESELQKQSDSRGSELGQLRERCNRLQEELDNSLNADRVLKERAGQLQVINTQYQRKINDQEGEIIKLSKIKSELMEERDQFMREKLELKLLEEKHRGELKQVKETNELLDKKLADMNRKLQQADPKVLREQRDLINDLKTKVLILEKELKSVHEGAEKEIENFKKENEALLAQRMDEELNKDMQKHYEKMTMQRLKEELISAKGELDQAAKQVAILNQEVAAQQNYYEGELQKLRDQIKKLNPLENDAIGQATLQARIKQLETKLRDAILDKDECLKQITLLQEELKLQEKHFSKQITSQLDHAQNLAKNSLVNDNKFVDMMTKLNDEQRKYFKEKTQYEQSVKITAEMARQKVKELEIELEKQQKYMDGQTEKYEQENKMLKEFQDGYKKELEIKEEQIQMLLQQVDKFKKEKKEAFSLVKIRDIELNRVQKRIAEIQKQNQDYQLMQSKLLQGRDLPVRPPSENSREHASMTPLMNRNGIKLPEIKQSRPQSQVRGASRGGQLPIAEANKLLPLKQNLTAEAFFQKWNQSGNNDAIKSELLDQVIGDNSLKLECVKRKQEFLLVLHQAFESSTPLIYERATIIVSELVDAKWIQQNELLALNGIRKIIRTLAPKKPTEDNNYTMTRQISALNLLCRLDKWDVEWNNQMSEEISRISGVETIIHFLEQSQHDNYKAQAAQIVGMIAEEGTINHLLSEQDCLSILVDSLLHKQITVKRNSAEALAFLIKDEIIRNAITNDRILHICLNEHQKSTDQIYSENLLLILMNLSLSKNFKPAMYESGLLDSLIYNIVNGHTPEEQIYAIRIAFNLCYNSEIKYRNYDKLHPYLIQVLNKDNVEVSIQALLLLKKFTESERTKIDNDMKILPALITQVRSSDSRLVELSMKVIMILCENNPKTLQSEFDNKGQGIQMCLEFYTNSTDPNLSLYSSQILVLYCLEGFVGEINQKGKIDFLNKLLRNFTAEDEKIRIQAIKMMSLLLQDQYIHDIVYQISDFQFLIADMNEMANYESLYPEEQDLLLYVLRIFGEFAKSAKMSEINITNGILPICIKILMDDQKFKKDVRIWALVIINRGAYHVINQIGQKIIYACLTSNPPAFLTFLLNTTDPEDPDLTIQSQNIWQVLEEYAQSRNAQIIQQFAQNYQLIEKLIMGTKRTLNSKSEISPNMRNIINYLRQANADIDRMVKEATTKLASQVQ